MSDALNKLIEAVEGGTFLMDVLPAKNERLAYNAFSGSLDAAKALHEAMVPEWTLNALSQTRHPDNGMRPTGQWEVLLFAAFPSRFAHISARSSEPARVWLLAILRAYAAQQEPTP